MTVYRPEMIEVAMNKAHLVLLIWSLAVGPAVAADLRLSPQVAAAEAPQVPAGPPGACRIYVQGRSSACRVTSEPACQRLSEHWHKPRFAIVSRRWYALPQGVAWDMPRC